MGLKAEKWFLEKCMAEIRGQSRLAGLASRAWDHAHGNHSTPGHILQAVGAAQLFLAANPNLVRQICSASPAVPLDLAAAGVLAPWLTFFSSRSGPYGNSSYKYNWSTLGTYLTPKFGGRCVGGGGGDFEFKIVLRLIAEF